MNMPDNQNSSDLPAARNEITLCAMEWGRRLAAGEADGGAASRFDDAVERLERAAAAPAMLNGVEDMRRIAELIATQDNRITAEPIFIVQQKRTHVSHPDYDHDRIVWVDGDGEATGEDAARLDAEYAETGDEPKGWNRCALGHTWEFVTACFTEQGCKDYIARNGHNLCEPRIYASGSYRNAEWRAVRNFLLTLRAADNRDAAGVGNSAEERMHRHRDPYATTPTAAPAVVSRLSYTAEAGETHVRPFPMPPTAAPAGEAVDFDDLITHRESWRSALVMAVTRTAGTEDESYWNHELRAFDRTFQAVNAALFAHPPAAEVREVDANDGHSDSCACMHPGDRECNCHKAYGFATAEEMEASDCKHDYRETADDRLPSSWIDVCAKCGHERGVAALSPPGRAEGEVR